MLLDAATRALRWQVRPGDWVYRLLFTPSGDALVASGDSDFLSVLDPADGTHRVISTDASARAVASTRDGTTAVVGQTLHGDAQAVVAFDLASGDRRWASEPLGRLPEGLAPSPEDDAIHVLINDPNERVVFKRDG